MSADNRTPHTDALATLGMIINENEKRDAIHLAVLPAQAAQKLKPGEHVGFLSDGRVGRTTDSNCVGIVDPFLEDSVKSDQWFWLIVYPRKITSLRHVWTWDAIDKHVISQIEDPMAAAKLTAKRYIEKEADRLGVEFDELIQAANNYQDCGEHWCQGDRFESEYIDPEFWNHWELFTGRTVTEDRWSFLSCSC